jgi:uncharacterized protein
MKRFLAVLAFCLVFSAAARAQQPAPAATGPDAPATKEDVEAYLQLTRSHDMMMKTIDAMSRPLQQMIHQEYLKDQAKLPPDFEERQIKDLDDTLKNFPFDEMTEAMVPAYQKYLTRGDLQAMTAFYSSPVGQKLLQQMPAITAEGMQDALPILTKYMETVRASVQSNINQALQQSPSQPAAAPPATQN